MTGTLVALHLVIAGMFGIPTHRIQSVQWADQAQSVQLQAAWGTPQVRWAKHAQIVAYLESQAQVNIDCGSGDLGCHGTFRANGAPGMVVAAVPGWPITLSHEIMETLVDPYGTRRADGLYVEIADPVENDTYQIAGRGVSDFVTPAWYWFGPNDSACVDNGVGPWDHSGWLTGPLCLDFGGYAVGTNGAVYYRHAHAQAARVRPRSTPKFTVALP